MSKMLKMVITHRNNLSSYSTVTNMIDLSSSSIYILSFKIKQIISGHCILK